MFTFLVTFFFHHFVLHTRKSIQYIYETSLQNP